MLTKSLKRPKSDAKRESDSIRIVIQIRTSRAVVSMAASAIAFVAARADSFALYRAYIVFHIFTAPCSATYSASWRRRSHRKCSKPLNLRSSISCRSHFCHCWRWHISKAIWTACGPLPFKTWPTIMFTGHTLQTITSSRKQSVMPPQPSLQPPPQVHKFPKSSCQTQNPNLFMSSLIFWSYFFSVFISLLQIAWNNCQVKLYIYKYFIYYFIVLISKLCSY